MAHLRRILCLAALAVGIVASAGAEEVQPLALEGTWHVLVHFKDQATNHPVGGGEPQGSDPPLLGAQ
jgi:hypothetical protein